MDFLPSNAEDIKRYYLDTFVKLPHTGDKLFYVTEVTGTQVLLHDSDKEEYVISLHEQSPYSLEMILPHKSMFQMGPSAYQMTRVPAQQYKRGICKSNCNITTLDYEGQWRKCAITFETLAGYTNKQEFIPLDSITGHLSVALSPRFCVSKVSNLLYCDTHAIGTFDGTTVTVDKLLFRELDLLIKRTCKKNLVKLEVVKG